MVDPSTWTHRKTTLDSICWVPSHVWATDPRSCWLQKDKSWSSWCSRSGHIPGESKVSFHQPFPVHKTCATLQSKRQMLVCNQWSQSITHTFNKWALPKRQRTAKENGSRQKKCHHTRIFNVLCQASWMKVATTMELSCTTEAPVPADRSIGKNLPNWWCTFPVKSLPAPLSGSEPLASHLETPSLSQWISTKTPSRMTAIRN